MLEKLLGIWFKSCYRCRLYLPLFFFRRTKNKYLSKKPALKGRVYSCRFCVKRLKLGKNG